LAENAEVPVVGMTASGDWLQLELEGGPGWVYAPFVQLIGEFPIPATDEGALPPISTSDIDLDRATEVVESFTGQTDIQLEFLGEAAMPNAGLRAGWKLTEPSGRLFWLDTETYSLVEMEPSPLVTGATEGSKSMEELRQAAEEIALERSVRFGELVDVLDYSEGDKLGQHFFFRWEDRTEPWSTMPPMLQVGLTGEGELFSWLNTLDLTD
jgi:hypothetical protein